MIYSIYNWADKIDIFMFKVWKPSKFPLWLRRLYVLTFPLGFVAQIFISIFGGMLFCFLNAIYTVLYFLTSLWKKDA